MTETEARTMWRRARLATAVNRRERQPSTCYSYLVDGALTAPFDVETAGRQAMIADGRAPGTVVNVDRDPCGSGKWEVVISHRPLRRGESFRSDGRRVGTGGTKAAE